MANFLVPQSKLRLIALAALVLSLSACSSDNGPPRRVDQGTPAWDYNQVRSVRDADAEQQRQQGQDSSHASRVIPTEIQDDSSCRILSKSAMLKEKISGCRLMEGRGDDIFCCPK